MLSATVAPEELPDHRWLFRFSKVVLVDRQRRTVEGQLKLGRTTAVDVFKPAEIVGEFLGGLAGQVPGVRRARDFAAATGLSHALTQGGQGIGQEVLGADGPSAAVVASGGVCEVRLSGPSREGLMYGALDLHGPGRLVLRGLPRTFVVLLTLERLS